MRPALVHVIVGRVEEVGVLDGFLAEGESEPRAMLIEGEPGIGKTTLLQELLAIARERGYTILMCRPTRSEMDLSYVGLVELLSTVDDPTVDALPAPQARVLKMLLRREEPDAAFDRLSLGLALVAAVRSLAVTGPVLVAVDDAQWLDHPSARTLAFVLRRLTGTAVRVAVVRSEGGWSARPIPGLVPLPSGDDPVDWADELTRAMPAGRLDRVRLGPVTPSQLSRILRRVLGWVPAWPRLVRIADLSGGNPLYALELARAFGASRADEDLDASLPESMVELARTRIANLPDRVREAVELASVPRAPRLDLLRRLDSAALDLRDALVSAARSGIVTLDEDRVRFTHPILAAAAYGSIPTQRRRELHHAVAMLSDDLEERARHLATAADGPDGHVALTLEGAAEQAWRRAAPDAAADLLRLACRLTPATDPAALALRRVAYGRLLHSAGDVAGSLAELESLVASLPPGVLRARALYHLMYVTRLSGSLGRSMEYGVQAAADAAGDASLQAEVFEMLSRLSDNDIGRKLDTARAALDAIERIAIPEPGVEFHVRAALVEAEFYAGLGIHLDRLDGLDPGTPGFPPVRTATRGDDLVGRLLAHAGRVDEGLELLRGLYDRAALAGRSILPAVLGWMAEAQFIGGRFAAAAELTREAIERSEEVGGTRGGNSWEVGWRAAAQAMLGQLDEAEANAKLVLARADAAPSPHPSPRPSAHPGSHPSRPDEPDADTDNWPARLALGIVANARDRFDDAAAALRRLDRGKQAAGIRDPRLVAHASELVEALVGAGELVEADEVVVRFETQAQASAGQPSIAAAARCRALVAAAQGDLDAALAAARHALAAGDGLGLPFEQARSRYVLGQVHRRRREKALAREALTAALAAFDDLATPIWSQRAKAELARVPNRMPATNRPDTVLTATEERIARLAVEGLTNREIADRTFLSPKTVEVNLTRIYRKLGVRSRAALAGQLAADREPRDQNS